MTDMLYSCYMASVTQTLLSLPAFQGRYYPNSSDHWQTCPEALPATCLECQMRKLADGLLSGRYSRPSTSQSAVADNPLAHDAPTPTFQEGIRPASFKALIGKGHEEFATMRQQDAEEFLAHLLKVLRQNAKRLGVKAEDEPTEIFRFGMEQRLQCTDCKKVRYRVDSQDSISIPVPAVEKEKDADGNPVYEDVLLTAALDVVTDDEALEYQCPACKKKVVAVKYVILDVQRSVDFLRFFCRKAQFATFPRVLVIHAKKFQLVNWVPRKLGRV